jgi:proteasome lid subunit RPN8/RPN11
VVRVVDANRGADRGRDYFRADPEYVARIEAVMHECGLQIIGIVHSHPSGVAAPSPADLDFAAAWRDRSPYLLGIAVEDGDSWRISPWVVRAGVRRDLCELARLAG